MGNGREDEATFRRQLSMAQWGWRVVMGNAAHPIRLRPEHSVLRQHHLEKTAPQPHSDWTRKCGSRGEYDIFWQIDRLGAKFS